MPSFPVCGRSCLVVFFLGLPVFALGCGGSEKIVPVSGKVMFGNEPLKLGNVTFQPDAAKGNKATDSAFAAVEADGSYKLIYKGKPGAPVGWYKVGVSSSGMPKEMPPPGQAMPQPAPINPKFNDPARSGIEIEVVESPAAGAYEIKVSR